jgi:hypothetical protein
MENKKGNHIMKSCYCVVTNNRLRSLIFDIIQENEIPNTVIKYSGDWKRLNCLNINNGIVNGTALNNIIRWYPEVTINEFLDILQNKELIMIGTNEVEFLETGINVGCQFVDKETIKKFIIGCLKRNK